MKKVLSLILALLMTTSAASYVFADDAIAGDAAADTPAATAAVAEEAEKAPMTYEERAAAFLSEYNIMVGYSEEVKELGLEDDIQRYQMALFVGRISTGWTDDDKWEDGPQNWSGFSDLDGTAAANYLGALSYASGKGIIEGYGDGRFGPEDGIAYQDGLTMIVRTLGYTGLNWPWGYIQKAVDLGITEGIEGVAYTDTLTRGQVAVLLYNALFTKTSTGEKLALKCFGAELGWEPIVITASDLDIFNEDNKNGDGYTPDLKDNNAYTYYPKSQKIQPGSEGLVAFKIIAEDGTLSDDTYYVESAELGIKSVDHSHEDELAVGDAYYVLFKENADNKQLVSIVPDCYFSLNVTTDEYDYDHDGRIENEGKTNDNGDAQEYAIQNFLANYALVEKYSTKNYVNTTVSTKSEILAFSNNHGATLGDYKEAVDSVIAIDWKTGDLLAPVTNAEGEITGYVVEWYYSPIYDWYWHIVNKKTGDVIINTHKYGEDAKYDSGWDDLDYYAIDWMSDKEFQDFKDKYTIWQHTYTNGAFAQTSIAKSAYASLKIFDTLDIDDENPKVDRAMYESYTLGYFYNSDCVTDFAHTGHKANTYRIDRPMSKAFANALTLTGAENAAAVAAGTKGTNYGDSIATGVDVVVEGQAIACKADNNLKARGWMVPGYTPVEDGNGGYKNGFVIYNYDMETGAIKVVKNITTPETTTDKDSYITTGVVQAYNVAKGTVVIDGVTYNFRDYAELEGNMFNLLTTSAGTAAEPAVNALYNAYFKTLFNQFVQYVVVDGSLVYIARIGDTTQDFIIVQSYAGMSDDGYIVVNGFLASELKYRQFKIGSYNNWMKGSYNYYIDNTQAAEAFTQGSVYAISSANIAENGRDTIYYVQIAGEYDNYQLVTSGPNAGSVVPVGNFTIESDYIASKDNFTIEITGDGYAKFDGNERKMKGTDTYIFLYKSFSPFFNTKDYRFVPYDFYQGVLPEKGNNFLGAPYIDNKGTKIVGTLLGYNANSWNSGKYIIVVDDAQTNFAFLTPFNKDQAQLVVLLGNNYRSASFDRLVNDDENWYLLGASTYTLTVFDLVTGATRDVIGVNMAPKKNHVYYCIDGYIIEDLGELGLMPGLDSTNYYDFIQAIQYMYGRRAPYTAGYFQIPPKYFVSNGKYYAATDFLADGSKDMLNARKVLEDLLKNESPSLGFTTTHNGQAIPKAQFYVVEFGANNQTITDITKVTTDKELNAYLKDWVDAGNDPITALGASYVYSKADGSIVVYLYLSSNKWASSSDKTDTGSIYDEDEYEYSDPITIIDDSRVTTPESACVYDLDQSLQGSTLDDASIKAQFIYRTNKVNGRVESYTIYGIKYFFDTDAYSYTDGLHAQLAKQGYSFGQVGDHGPEGDYQAQVLISTNGWNTYLLDKDNNRVLLDPNAAAPSADVVWGSIVEETYDKTDKDCPGCSVVSAISIMFEEPVVLETYDNDFNVVTFQVMLTRLHHSTPAFSNDITTAYNDEPAAVSKEQRGLGAKNAGGTQFWRNAFADLATEGNDNIEVN